MSKSISIDFDGVIHDYSEGWTGPIPTGEPIPGAKDFIQICLDKGLHVYISSCRAYTEVGLHAIRDWLVKYEFPGPIHVTCEKPHADWYIDDRAIRFNGSFSDVMEEMEKPVWFKQNAEPEFKVG